MSALDDFLATPTPQPQAPAPTPLSGFLSTPAPQPQQPQSNPLQSFLKAPAVQNSFQTANSTPMTTTKSAMNLSNVAGGAGEVAKDIKTVITAPSTPKSSPLSDAGLKAGVKTLTDTINDAGKRLADAAATVTDKNKSLLQKGTSIGEVGMGLVNSLFLPINVPLSVAQTYPGVGQLVDGVNKLFGILSVGGADAVEGAVDALPISDEDKATIMPLFKEAGALGAQILAGKVGGEVLPKLAKTSQEIMGHVKTFVNEHPELQRGFIKNPLHVPPEHQALTDEAKKFNSAEEFVDHYAKNPHEIPTSPEYKEYLSQDDAYVKQEKDLYAQLRAMREKYNEKTIDQVPPEDIAKYDTLRADLEKTLSKKTSAKSPDVPIKTHIGDKALRSQLTDFYNKVKVEQLPAGKGEKKSNGVPIKVPPLTRFAANLSEPPRTLVNQFEHETPQPAPVSGPVNPAHVDQYLQKFGPELNTDNARELFTHYTEDRSRSADVHEPASDIVKAAYAKLLDSEQGKKNNTVLFTGGGTGAGKSTALRLGGIDTAEYPIVYDTNLNSVKSAAAKIDQALARGYDVKINYVHNDVHTALENAMGRAERMAQEKGSGRTVPLETHHETHAGGPETLPQLYDKYKENAKVQFSAIDNEKNTFGNKFEGKEAIDFVKGKRYNVGNADEIKTKLQKQVEQAHSEGRISEQTKVGFLGKDAAGTREGDKENVAPGAGEVLGKPSAGEQNGAGDGGRAQEGAANGDLPLGKLSPTDALVELAARSKTPHDFFLSVSGSGLGELAHIQSIIDPDHLTHTPQEAAQAFYSYVRENLLPQEKDLPKSPAGGDTATGPAAKHLSQIARTEQQAERPARAGHTGEKTPTNQKGAYDKSKTDKAPSIITEHNAGVEPPENKGGLHAPEIDWSGGKDIAAIRQSTDTLERTLEKIFPRETAGKLNEFLTQADRHNEADRGRYVTEVRTKTHDYVVKELGVRPASISSALAQRFGEGRLSLDELKKEAPRNWEQIKKASDFFRTQYDDLIDRWNRERFKAGLKPITKRPNYFRHFTDLTGWTRLYGIDFKEMDIPTEISGITEFFRSQSPWTNAAMRRLGHETSDDAVGGFDNYLNSVSKAIYHTDTVQRGRLIEKYVRNTARAAGEARAKALESGEDKEVPPAIKLPRFAQTMKGWTDKVSGKQNIFDRSFEAMVGRPSLAVMRALTRQFGLNVIGGNVSAAVTHAIPMVYTLATVNKGAAFRALLDTLQSPFLADYKKIEGGNSDFLARRFSRQQIQRTLGEQAGAILSSPFHASDMFISRFAVSAKYYEGVQRGLTPEVALRQADNYASRVIGDRSSGNLPPIMSTKTLGWLTQFQIEVNDNLRVLIHDIPYEAQGDILKISNKLVQFAIYSYFFNQTMQYIKGSGKGLDPIDLGLTLAGLNDAGHDQSMVARLKTVATDLAKELPFASIPTSGQVPAFQPLQTAITDALTGSPLKGLPGVLAAFISPIGGGTQAVKTYNAIDAWRRGYVTDTNGKVVATIPHTLPTLAQGVLFGPNAFASVKKSKQEVANLSATLKEQQAAGKLKDTQARNMARELLSMDKDAAAKQFDTIATQDPDMAKRVATAVKNQMMGLTKGDVIIKTLGIGDGARAKYLAAQFNALQTQQEKADLWEHLIEIKAITPEIADQLGPLLKK